MVTALLGGRVLATKVIEGRGDFRMAASSVVFADALLVASSEPGVWSPEEVLSLDQLAGNLSAAGITVSTHT